MLRSPDKYLIWIITLIAIVAVSSGDCRSQEIMAPDSGQMLDEKASDSVKNLPMTVPEDSSVAATDSLKSDTVILEPVLYIPGEDSLLVSLYNSQDTSKSTVGSPTLNLFKSMIFPGWGQFCNRRYIKAGVIFAIESYLIYKAVDNGRQASDWHTKWKEASTTSLKTLYFGEYTDYRDRRNTFLWYTALTVFLSMFDAYVDTHLQNFPKNTPGVDKISIDASPGEETRLTLRYNF